MGLSPSSTSKTILLTNMIPLSKIHTESKLLLTTKPVSLIFLIPLDKKNTAMRDQYMRKGHGFLFVYAITDRSSFDQLTSLRDQLLRAKDAEHIPYVVVGNKCDLESERQITKTEGSEIAKSFGQCPFFGTSAKSAINVEEAFGELVREIRKDEAAKGNGPKKKKGGCSVL